MIEFPSAAGDRAVLAALEEDAAACDLTTQWSVPAASCRRQPSSAAPYVFGREADVDDALRNTAGAAGAPVGVALSAEASVADFGSSAEERVARNAAVCPSAHRHERARTAA